MMVNTLHSLAELQLESSSHGSLIADQLPGLTAEQRAQLKSKAGIHARLSAKTKDQADVLGSCVKSNF